MRQITLTAWKLWVLLLGFVAVASGLLAWFVTQSRMEVKLAEQREMAGGDARRHRSGAAGDEGFLEGGDPVGGRIGQARTRANHILMNRRKSLVLQERMYFRTSR